MRATTKAEREAALTKAQMALHRKLTDLKRLVNSIQLWESRVKYYTAQLSMTDEERQHAIEATRQRAAQNKNQKRIRRITTLTGD
jgi:hypothetical protein